MTFYHISEIMPKLLKEISVAVNDRYERRENAKKASALVAVFADEVGRKNKNQDTRAKVRQ